MFYILIDIDHNQSHDGLSNLLWFFLCKVSLSDRHSRRVRIMTGLFLNELFTTAVYRSRQDHRDLDGTASG